MTKELEILFIIATIIIVLAGVCLAEEDVITQINCCFENEQFTQGLNILQKGLNERTELKPALLLMKADFYENYAGNLLQAKRFYQQLIQLNLPEDQKYMIDARAGIKRIGDYDRKYAKEIKLFAEIEKRTGEDTKSEKLTAQLLEIISSNSDKLLLANAYYYLGNVYLDQKIYWPAYRMSLKVLELKPAFYYYLPVNTLRYDAYKQWLLNLITNIVWTLLLALLIFIALVFYLSRPWQWLSIKIAVSAIIIILFFSAICLLTMWIVNKTAAPPPDYMSPPVYYKASFGEFNTWLPVKCLLYILTASAGTIILVTSTLKFRHRCTWCLINILTTILLFSSLFTVFFSRYSFSSSNYSINSFYREKSKTFSYFSGRTFFRLKDVRPFVLTNPRAYPDLGTKKMDEPVFAHWLEKVGKIIKKTDESAKSQK
jgi:tetratricopeptide (TPR) repeat protein